MMNKHTSLTHQSGAVLIVSLIMLLLLTLIGTTGMQSTTLEEKMAGNMRNKELAFQAAESALKAAEASLNPPPLVSTFVDAGTGGFYSNTSTIPTASAILTDSFWTANPFVTSSVTTLGNDIATPVYIIQDMGVADCTGAAIGSGGCRNYRITARATGGTANAVVILQSFYLR
jgi:type IV pilus assembly protein PilX